MHCSCDSAKAMGMLQAVGLETGVVQLECDVVVCGSGAGGGVAAALLAQAGLRVIVLEKSQWCRAVDMSLLEGESMAAMCDYHPIFPLSPCRRHLLSCRSIDAS